MKSNKLWLLGLGHAILIFFYIYGVVILMSNAQRLFGAINNNILGAIAFLLLFVVSALITGTLVLGLPIYLFLNGEKIEALKMFFYTAGWLILIAILVFMTLLI
jgi:hypothetical protein